MPIFDIQAPDGKSYEVDGPNIAGALDALKQYLGQAATPPAAPEESSTALGTAKALGTGVVKGGISLAGLPGDIREKLADIGEKFGVSRKLISAPIGLLPAMGGPTSGQITGAVEGAMGPLYQPKGAVEETAQTIGEFLPGLIGGPETIAAKLGTRVLAPALASEAAGQITKGTEAEPYARAIGGLAGGIAGIKGMEALTQKAIPRPGISEIKAAGSTLYKALGNAEFESSYAKNVANDITRQLRTEKFSDKSAPGVFDFIKQLKEPGGPQVPTPGLTAAEALGGKHTFDDFQTLRTRLSEIAGKATNAEQPAAIIAINALDKHLNNIPASVVRNMSPEQFSTLYNDAKAEWSTYKGLQKVTDKLEAAKLQAASTNSGGNFGNAARQKLRPLATTAKGQRGLSQETLDLIESGVLGSPIQNVLRSGSKYLGAGGGIGVYPGMIGSYLATGNPVAAFAAPVAGKLMKAGADYLTKRNANKIIESIAKRSPTYQAYLASLPPKMDKRLIAARLFASGLLGRQDQQSLLAPISQFQQ